MAAFFNALSAVSLLLLLMGTGYFMAQKGWMGQKEKAFLGKYIINIAIPCTAFTGITGNLSLEMLSEFGILVILAYSAVISIVVISFLIGKTMGLPSNRKGTFVAMAGLSNTIFIGYPVATHIFGDESIPYLMIYYVANTTLLQTVGCTLIRNDGAGEGNQVKLLQVLKNLLHQPPFLGTIAGFLTIGLQLKIPDLLMEYTSYLGGTVSTMALIYCGYVLYDLGLKNLRLMPGHGTMLVTRLVIAPIITWCLATAFGVPDLIRQVFTVMSALPVVTQVTVFAGVFGADEEYAASGSCMSTLLCCLSIPVLVVVMSLIGG